MRAKESHFVNEADRNAETVRRGYATFALAVVLAVATWDCAPRDEKKAAQDNAEEVAQDNEALDQLRSAGSNLTKPHQIEFYLYLPSEADAEAVAATLRPLGYSVTVRAGDNNINWLCIASRTMMPTIQEITEARGVFKSLATTHRGAYGGWEAAIER